MTSQSLGGGRDATLSLAASKCYLHLQRLICCKQESCKSCRPLLFQFYCSCAERFRLGQGAIAPKPEPCPLNVKMFSLQQQYAVPKPAVVERAFFEGRNDGQRLKRSFFLHCPFPPKYFPHQKMKFCAQDFEMLSSEQDRQRDSCYYNKTIVLQSKTPRVGPGHPSSPLSIFPLFAFPFLSLALPIFSFVHPFPFYQNSPIPFPGRRSQEATEPGSSFFVCVLLVLSVFLS